MIKKAMKEKNIGFNILIHIKMDIMQLWVAMEELQFQIQEKNMAN